MKNYSYIGISFILLVFGIWSVPKIVDKFSNNELSYLLDINEEPRKVPNFSFINQLRKQVTNETLKGKVYVVEFFFKTSGVSFSGSILNEAIPKLGFP